MHYNTENPRLLYDVIEDDVIKTYSQPVAYHYIKNDVTYGYDGLEDKIWLKRTTIEISTVGEPQLIHIKKF